MREYFAYRGSKELLDLIDRAGQRAGVGRSRAFSDWLEMRSARMRAYSDRGIVTHEARDGDHARAANLTSIGCITPALR